VGCMGQAKNRPKRTRGANDPVLPNIFPFLDIPFVAETTSPQAWEETAWNKVVVHLGTLNTKEIDSFLRVALSRRERDALLKRVVAIQRVNGGASYTEINEELKLSPQTISALKKSTEAQKYQTYSDQAKDEKKKKYRGSYLPDSETDHDPRPYRNTKYGKLYY